MGGWSPEREISLKTGQNITDTLKEAGYNVVGIDIGKSLKGGKYIPKNYLNIRLK